MRLHNISLLGMIAIVTCAAIGISHVITSIRLSRVSAELAALRTRLELIPVEDTDCIAARRLPSTDENVQKWAIRVPKMASIVLYANWGPTLLKDVRDPNARNVRTFKLSPDVVTHESTVTLRVERNLHDSKWGVIRIEHSGNSSSIAIDQTTTSLLTGSTPHWSEAIGDSPATRPLQSSITLFGIESTTSPTASFCLWLEGSQIP